MLKRNSGGTWLGFPMTKLSPDLNIWCATLSPFTQVPFKDRQSMTCTPPSLLTTRACVRETILGHASDSRAKLTTLVSRPMQKSPFDTWTTPPSCLTKCTVQPHKGKVGSRERFEGRVVASSASSSNGRKVPLLALVNPMPCAGAGDTAKVRERADWGVLQRLAWLDEKGPAGGLLSLTLLTAPWTSTTPQISAPASDGSESEAPGIGTEAFLTPLT